jgi:hypothetical protein
MRLIPRRLGWYSLSDTVKLSHSDRSVYEFEIWSDMGLSMMPGFSPQESEFIGIDPKSERFVVIILMILEIIQVICWFQICPEAERFGWEASERFADDTGLFHARYPPKFYQHVHDHCR